jgi:hypothetical protein
VEAVRSGLVAYAARDQAVMGMSTQEARQMRTAGVVREQANELAVQHTGGDCRCRSGPAR